MSGDLTQRVAEEKNVLEKFLQEVRPGRALDLGCGHGIHTLALAELGMDVTAVDFSAILLRELQQNLGQHGIALVESDMVRYVQADMHQYDIITCMGDTITHLTSRDEVSLLIHQCSRLLNPEGTLCLSLRNYERELTGADRFIPVRSDNQQILTCLLEFHAEIVLVHDLLHLRSGSEWKLKASSYPKLRLNFDWLRSQLIQAGLTINKEHVVRGMHYLFCQKN